MGSLLSLGATQFGLSDQFGFVRFTYGIKQAENFEHLSKI